jgi:hypothetical protein
LLYQYYAPYPVPVFIISELETIPTIIITNRLINTKWNMVSHDQHCNSLYMHLFANSKKNIVTVYFKQKKLTENMEDHCNT